LRQQKKIINDLITAFINTSTIVLNDPNYSSGIFWEYPISKNTQVENLRISFRLPYGYFSEDLIVERVGNNQPIRKKVYLQINSTANNSVLQNKLDVLFQTQARIVNDLNLYKVQVDKEIEEIQSGATEEDGEELNIQFMNLIDGVITKLRELKIQLTDKFTYQDWVYKL
jgi:hypothetical protein